MSVRLKNISEISNEETEQLINITKHDMSKIGTGKTWNIEYVNSLKVHAKGYYNWIAINTNNDVIGYVGIRPFKDFGSKARQIRIFVWPTGKGYGSSILKELSIIYKGQLHAIVSKDNIASNKLFLKNGWMKITEKFMYGRVHIIYVSFLLTPFGLKNNIDKLIDDFPYRSKMYKKEHILRTFDILKKESLVRYSTEKTTLIPSIKLDYTYYQINNMTKYLLYDPSKYQLYMLSDMFVDDCRVKCKFGSEISPYEYYQKNKIKILDEMRIDNIPLTAYNVRDYIYFNTKECSIHNPLIIRYFIKMADAKKVLDFSSGWGDRLIGCMLENIDIYQGVDPNICLKEKYNKIIKTFQSRCTGQYNVISAGIQDVELTELYDLFFTSPPYFDYEKYIDSSDQSINLGSTEDEWLNNFLYPNMSKCIKSIKKHGLIVLYFSQEKGKSYIEKWMIWMKSRTDISYIGGMIYADIMLKGKHPIFIFKKLI
jgi:hypothetical protein